MSNVHKLHRINSIEDLSDKVTSDKYGLVKTSELVSRLEQNFADVLNLDQARVGRGGGGTKHHVTIPLSGGATYLDGVIPTITIINSYQGETALKLLIGFYRVACSNGMVVGDGVYQQSVRHIKGQKLEGFLDGFEQKVAAAIGDVQDVLSYVDSTRSMEVDSRKILPILSLLGESGAITKRALESAWNIYLTDRFRRYEDWQVRHTIYGLWNIINEELRRSATSRTTSGSLLERNRKLLGEILRATEEVAA